MKGGIRIVKRNRPDSDQQCETDAAEVSSVGGGTNHVYLNILHKL